MLNLKKLLSISMAVLLLPAVVFAENAKTSEQTDEISASAAKSVLSGKYGEAAKAVPAPAEAVEVEENETRGQYDFNPPCPAPRGGFYPVVEDQNRVNAMNELLGKIYRHEQLPFSHDGIVFQNKEGRLPRMPYGYYHEYTLLPPGQNPATVTIGGVTYPIAPKLSKRGAERLIIGGGQVIYYTPDHYGHFIQLQVTDASRAYQTALCPAPGKDFTPKIEDNNRIYAINELLGKIYRNEQFQYSHDGIVFKNKEGKLPQMPNGYYHEYTLLPPGQYPSTITIGGHTYQMGQKLSKRGAERIIIGGGQYIYYTPDHYQTFIQLYVVY